MIFIWKIIEIPISPRKANEIDESTIPKVWFDFEIEDVYGCFIKKIC